VANQTLKEQAYPIFVIVLAMWLVRITDAVIPYDLTRWGLLPRSLSGLLGIGSMPFLHANFEHLLSNTIPLVILLGLTVASRHRAWPVVVSIIVGNGLLLWLFGRTAYHIGASGLVFGLIAYLITVGVREKQIVSIAIALLVGFLFGGTLLTGVIPRFSSAMSWDGHLFGAISGLVIGVITTKHQAARLPTQH
jgi:membrane associated rhomboid family serine protease